MALKNPLSEAAIFILSFRFLLSFLSLFSPFRLVSPHHVAPSKKKKNLKFNHNKQICSPTGHHWVARSNSARYSNQWPCSLNAGPELIICMTLDELADSLSPSLSLPLSLIHTHKHNCMHIMITHLLHSITDKRQGYSHRHNAGTRWLTHKKNTIKTEAVSSLWDKDVKFLLNINPTYCSHHVLWFLSAAAGGQIMDLDWCVLYVCALHSVYLWVLWNWLFTKPFFRTRRASQLEKN